MYFNYSKVILFYFLFNLFECKKQILNKRDVNWINHVPIPITRDSQSCSYQVYNYIKCTSDKELSIKSEIEQVKYSLRPPSEQPIFDEFKWTAPVTDGVIPSQSFNGLQLRKIYLTSNNLERIHSSAFNGILHGTWYFKQSGPSKLRSDPSNGYDLYKALMSLTDLQYLTISLDSNIKHEIPDNAFAGNRWDELERLEFNGQFTISRIGNNFINSVPNSLEKIYFEDVVIESVAQNAFQIKACKKSCDRLDIYLKSTRLNENKIEPGAFNIAGRDVELHLENNEIQILSEDLFGFLLNSKNNKIHFDGNSLKCSSKTKSRFQWLLNKPELKKRISNALCSNGKSIWDFNWDEDIEEIPETTENISMLCNEMGEYDGQYGVDKWPVVSVGQYSEVNCSKGEGVIRWKCLEGPVFDERGPEFKCSVDELLDNIINTVEEIRKSLRQRHSVN